MVYQSHERRSISGSHADSPRGKNSINVPNIDTSRSLKAGSCTFAATGDITVGTNKITVVDVDINKEICESDIEAIFLSDQMRPGSNNEEFLPEMVRDMIVELEMKSTKKELEEMVWQGDTAGGAGNHLDILDGLIKKFLADAAVVDVATPVTLTTANIETEIGKVVAAIPEAMLNEQNNPKVGIGISLKARTLYRASLAQNSPVMYRNTPVDEQLTFDGWKLFPLDGMPTNTMCFGNFDKIWLAPICLRTLVILPLSR